jgi:hypothetical protein
MHYPLMGISSAKNEIWVAAFVKNILMPLSVKISLFEE